MIRFTKSAGESTPAEYRTCGLPTPWLFAINPQWGWRPSAPLFRRPGVRMRKEIGREKDTLGRLPLLHDPTKVVYTPLPTR
jgi:hypothetical protein